MAPSSSTGVGRQRNLLATLEGDCGAHPLFSESGGFLDWIRSPKLRRQELRRFALFYYPHVTRTRLFQAALLSICPTQDTQAALARILYDEYGAEDPHHRHLVVYEQLFSGLAIEPSELRSVLASEDIGTSLYAAAMSGLVRQGHWARAYGAVGIGGELPIPRLYEALFAAFSRTFGDEIDSSALAIFRTHIDCDDDHTRLLVSAIEPLTFDEPAIWDEIRSGFALNLESRRIMLNAVMKRSIR